MKSKVLIPFACVVGPLLGYCLGLCVPHRTHAPDMTLWKTVNRPETLPEPTNSLVGNTPFAPTTYAVEAKSDGIRPLEELMPKWEIRSNSPSQYQIAFQAHDQPDWTVSTNIFTTEEQAQSVIDGVKLKLSVNYTALKAVHDAFWKGK